MRILALLMYATAVVCTTLAFSGSFETARTEEINGVIRVSDGLVMIGLSEKYDEPYIETLVLKIDFSGEVLWVEEYGTPGDDVGRCLTVTGERATFFWFRVSKMQAVQGLWQLLSRKTVIKFGRSSMVRTETICRGRHVSREMAS